MLVSRMEKDPKEKWEGKVSATLRNALAKQTWELVKDFFNLHKWFPTLATCYGIHGSNGEPGCIRYCSGSSIPSDGADQRLSWSKERLLAIDHDERTIVYEIVESNIGFNSYRSTMKVSPMAADGHDGSLIEWHFSLDPIDGWVMQDLIAKYDLGLQRMAAKMDHHIHSANSPNA
ncbi:lachrymatory-factor synthase-like [Neltuma alba]|uniref:lachrymatory-factor synthase-like n=1 Tax=Neltuma alba TaxID=207710 RepID=UPI0010A38F63|nr:lachrymatory-factor synthase-like [Prosopis alba]